MFAPLLKRLRTSRSINRHMYLHGFALTLLATPTTITHIMCGPPAWDCSPPKRHQGPVCLLALACVQSASVPKQ